MTSALTDVVTMLRFQQQWFKSTTTASFRPFRPNTSHRISTETTSEANSVNASIIAKDKKDLRESETGYKECQTEEKHKQ